MIIEFLKDLRSRITEEEYKIILNIVREDIQFNFINFNKEITQEEFIEICKISYNIVINFKLGE
ncbi:hypothetical protein [Clostridium beijerinckii]|uniref:hypothetical protein n=1 Tax=Clostridium beijerinckii TaxID=1520 RepID=UPI00149467AA|nr:hypothetical protein [Clostridium beijerinckii]NOW07816.1 hypothetical protein [Clostridium beijerinckii]NYC04410.1 hypothetical protein [Clostridium beijerinckii]NYC05447.1 hypothetical protein [Clostridium beijerinckii]